MINRIEIDLSAVVHNFKEARRIVGANVEIFPVIKSDAYGHGLVPVAQALQTAGADGFLVASIDEAVALREAGISLPVILHVAEPKDSFEILEFNISPVIFGPELVAPLVRQSERRGRTIRAYVKVETGMGRLGIAIADLQGVLSCIKDKKGIDVLGLMSHLSSADNDDDYTLVQLQRFKKAIEIGRSLGLSLPKNHIANSAGLINCPPARMELVRPGIMIYGVNPTKYTNEDITLKPAMAFKTKIVQISSVPAGTPISYGQTYVTSEPGTIAAIPVGYENGYLRSISNKGEVLIRGRRAPILGRICMCLTLIDVSHIENVQLGDEVVIFGQQADQIVSVNEAATWGDTISYEILCGVGNRNPRFFYNAEPVT